MATFHHWEREPAVSLHPLGVYWCDNDKRVQWRRDRACVLNPDTCSATFPTCSKTGPARAAFVVYTVGLRCVTRAFIRHSLGMVRLIVNTAAHWSGITIYYYRSQHSHHSRLSLLHAHLHSISQARGSFPRNANVWYKLALILPEPHPKKMHPSSCENLFVLL